MDIRLPYSRLMTLERAAYGVALRKAARLGGVFRTAKGRQIVVVLRLPQGANLREYQAAAMLLVKEMAPSTKFGVVRPDVDRKGILDTTPVFQQLEKTSSCLALWPPGHDVPQNMLAAADRVVDVDPVRPFHLVAAVKSTHRQILQLSLAEQMLSYPVEAVFAALRPGRPFEEVLRRLDDAAKPPRVDVRARLEEMVGYGEAKDWGLSLAGDIALWRQRRLPWSDVDRGLLLSGPPGTGKTLFAQALARTCESELVATSVSRWQSYGHLGDLLGAMRKTFETAIARRPSIIFLDELDSIGDRAAFSHDYAQYSTQVVNGLLELVDGHERLEGVVVIGATNFPEKIDPALLRPGRLDRHIKISLPDAAARKQLARSYFRSDLTEEDLNKIAFATAGFSGAAFEKAGREVRRVARKAGDAVTLDMVLRVLPPSLTIEGERRRAIAVHESGHAVVGVHLAVGILEKVAVSWEVRNGQPSGFAYFRLPDEREHHRQSYLDKIAMLLGGRAAEEEILGTAYEGAGGSEGSDLHVASDLATMMEIQFGMGEGLSYLNVTSIERRDRIRRENPEVAARVERVLVREMERSREIVRRHRTALEAVAAALERNGVVEGKEVFEHLSGEVSR